MSKLDIFPIFNGAEEDLVGSTKSDVRKKVGYCCDKIFRISGFPFFFLAEVSCPFELARVSSKL